MKKLTINEWKELKEKAFQMTWDNPHLRIGQCLFNILYETRPDLCEMVRGTENDPFYSEGYCSERVVNFFYVVVEQEND